MESVTAWLWGPFSFWAVYAFLTNKPYRFLLQLIISVGKMGQKLSSCQPQMEINCCLIVALFCLTQARHMERYSTSSQSTEMATPTASWDIQSTSGSTLCLWIPCGSSYRWRSFWMHGNICQKPRGKRTAQSHRRIRRTECVRVYGGGATLHLCHYETLAIWMSAK